MENNNLSVYSVILSATTKFGEGNNWTEVEKAVMKDHLEYLRNLYNEGTLLQAGRTEVLDLSTYGFLIYKAENDEKANEIAAKDPIVETGMMTAKVTPYKIAFGLN